MSKSTAKVIVVVAVAAVMGVGYAGRKVVKQFLKTLEGKVAKRTKKVVGKQKTVNSGLSRLTERAKQAWATRRLTKTEAVVKAA